MVILLLQIGIESIDPEILLLRWHKFFGREFQRDIHLLIEVNLILMKLFDGFTFERGELLALLNEPEVLHLGNIQILNVCQGILLINLLVLVCDRISLLFWFTLSGFASLEFFTLAWFTRVVLRRWYWRLRLNFWVIFWGFLFVRNQNHIRKSLNCILSDWGLLVFTREIFDQMKLILPAYTAATILVNLFLMLVVVIPVLKVTQLLIGFQILVLIEFNDIIKFVDLISAELLNLLPFFLFKAIAFSRNARNKQFHCYKWVRASLMGVSFPFDIRFIGLLC